MHRAESVYTGAVLSEMSVLFMNSVLSILQLWQLETEQKIDYIKWMTLVTLIISCVLIPIESAVLNFWYKKHSVGRERAFQTRISQIALPKLKYIFGALWVIHFVSFDIIAGRYNWHQGSDVYMYYVRPGSRIIFLSMVSTLFPEHLFNKYRDDQNLIIGWRSDRSKPDREEQGRYTFDGAYNQFHICNSSGSLRLFSHCYSDFFHLCFESEK